MPESEAHHHAEDPTIPPALSLADATELAEQANSQGGSYTPSDVQNFDSWTLAQKIAFLHLLALAFEAA